MQSDLIQINQQAENISLSLISVEMSLMNVTLTQNSQNIFIRQLAIPLSQYLQSMFLFKFFDKSLFILLTSLILIKNKTIFVYTSHYLDKQELLLNMNTDDIVSFRELKNKFLINGTYNSITKQLSIKVNSREGENKVYQKIYTEQTTTEQIKHILSSGLLENIFQLYLLLACTKDSINFQQQTSELIIFVPFGQKIKTIKLPLDLSGSVSEDIDFSKLFAMLSIQTQQEKQEKIKNGQLYFNTHQNQIGKYEGQFLNDYQHGKGKFWYKEGDYYQGDYQQGYIHGLGKYIYASGQIYQGYYVDYQKCGKGKYVYKDGASYQGIYQHDMMHGPGKYTYASGETYIGHYQMNKRQGYCFIFYNTGDVFSGNYHNDLKQGFGRYYFAKGQILQSQYVKGKSQGKGKYYFCNGDTWEGNFKNNLKNGKALQTKNDGTIFISFWIDDVEVTEQQYLQSIASNNANPIIENIEQQDSQSSEDY